ncbi:MAG TPA: MBL fold metallo-hydrolase, partial [Atopobiaceae bacterium]|nr:MBL fold metallo-hydrolase [Atopobiaceae bacterium]
ATIQVGIGAIPEAIVAMHISEKNNRPSIAVRALAKAVGAEAANSTFTEARTPDGHLSICAAAQARPLSVW